MIANIFLKISEKYMLTDKTITLLMQCVDDLNGLEKKIFGESNWRTDIEKEFKSLMSSSSKKREFLQVNNIRHDIDEEESIRIILSELKTLRLVAIATIPNCANRNSEILAKRRLKHMGKYTEDDDKEFKRCILEILKSVKNDPNVDYKKVFIGYLKQLEQGDDIESSIDHIYDQSKDEKRCKELFNVNSITVISNLFRQDISDEKIMINACATINNYLQFSSTTGLNETQLRNYCNLINNSKYSGDLKTEALKSIVLTVEKNNVVPEFIIETLFENINKNDDKFDNFVIMFIGIISKRQKIENINNLSTKLLEDWIIIRDGAEIDFEKCSQDNSDCQSISSIVAQIFVNSLQKNIKISDESIENLTKALKSKDKQTCILSAKSLYLASDTHNIKNEVLVTLKEYIDNKINDVSVYSTVAYARGLAKLSSANEAIMTSHIGFLPNIYVFEDLQLDKESFTDVVNESILFILSREAPNHEFEEEIFQIFDHILSFENDYQKEIIEILLKYSANRYSIPDSTVLALENIINTPELFVKILEVFKNVVRKKQIIGEKILRIVADNLYLSSDNDILNKSFYILNMANDNQDIPDDIFDILELEMASLTVRLGLSDINDAVAYLCEKTKEGKKVTINGFRALSKVIIHNQLTLSENVLKILLNISNNRQMIPNDLIDKIVEKFDPKLVQPHLIEIFENLVKNNQDISEKLLTKLTIALDNRIIFDKVIFIFLLRGQQGEILSEKIIRKILVKFFTIENPLIMQQYLPVICSVIEKKDYFKNHIQNLSHKTNNKSFNTNIIEAIKKALTYALKTDNQDIIRKSISGFKTLRSLHQVEFEKESIEILLQIAANINCDESTKEEISELLSSSKLEGNQKIAYELIYLTSDSDSDFLDKLIDIEKPKLFKQNFDKINSIIDKNSELKLQALKILLNCSNKENIPDKLLDSIAALLESNKSERIQSLCCKLIGEIVKVGRIVTNKIILLVLDLKEKEKSADIIKLIAENQTIPEDLQDIIRLSLGIHLKKTTDSELLCLCELLKYMRKEFGKEQKFSDRSISTLLESNISKNIIKNNLDLTNELIDIYALILMQDPDKSSNEIIVDSLENTILSKRVTKNILNAYKEIIKQKKFQTNRFSNVFGVFIDILNHDEHYKNLHIDILVCIALASESTKISEFKYLESNLSNDNELIRSWSFRGLRAAYEKGSNSLIFKQWCNHIVAKLEEKTKINIDIDSSLDLFEIIASLEANDFSKIQDKPQYQWNRELFMFYLIERFQMREEQYIIFKQVLLDIEKHEGYENGQSDILLKLLHRFIINNSVSFDECYQAIKIIKEIDFESVRNILSNSKNLLVDLKNKYITVMICQRLFNKNEINCEYIEILSKMILKLGFDISKKLLDALQNIDNLREFENLLIFSQQNNIKISDIYVKNKTISILKRSLEIKFLGNQIENVDRLKLGIHLDRLLDQSWTFEQLDHLFKIFKESDNQNKLRYFMSVLEILSNCKIHSKDQEKIKLSLKKPVENWPREINKVAVEAIFTEKSQGKTSTDLV
ncbi:unnamed protein product, partial [Rotaria sordida]